MADGLPNQQKIIEFRKRTFWVGQLDLAALNRKIFQLNQEGWRLVSVIPNTAFTGAITSYTLFVEKQIVEKQS